MPPRAHSRHRFDRGVQDAEGRWALTFRDPLRFHPHPDNRLHRVVQGDTWWGLAGRYFAPWPRACGLWWVLADFQPVPVVDPTLALAVGTPVVVPSMRVVTAFLLRPTRPAAPEGS